jgi:hypothetical protein
MNVPDKSKVGFAALLELAESKFHAWHLKELRPERSRRISELKNENLSFQGKVLREMRTDRELLELQTRRRIAFYAEVAHESDNAEMLSQVRLGEFRQRIVDSVEIFCKARMTKLGHAARAAGEPLESPPSEHQYRQLQAEILDVVNAELRVLEAEGKLAGQHCPIGGNSAQRIAAGAMATDSAFWRRLREDFESLQPGQFSVIWSSRPPVGYDGEPLQSLWSWWRFPGDSLRARLSAMALKGAKALGYDSEDLWFDELRRSDFVNFKVTGRSQAAQPDGTMIEWEFGSIDDVVRESITLCHILEAGGSESTPKGSSRDAEGIGAGLAQPASEVPIKGRKRGPKPDYETASRVAEIVARVAPDGDWRSKRDEICEALDNETIPFPAKWRRDRRCRCWSDCIEAPIVIKAIEYRLETAKQRSQPTPETLS